MGQCLSTMSGSRLPCPRNTLPFYLFFPFIPFSPVSPKIFPSALFLPKPSTNPAPISTSSSADLPKILLLLFSSDLSSLSFLSATDQVDRCVRLLSLGRCTPLKNLQINISLHLYHFRSCCFLLRLYIPLNFLI